MRRIVMFNRVSADGYFADQNGGLGWVIPDPELDRSATEHMPQTDTILFGRRTYEMFESFWPHVAADPAAAADPHGAGPASPEMLAMAAFINDATKIVFSRTRQDVTWRNSHLLHALDPERIEAMKREPGKDMIVFGSGTLVSQLTQHGLIDEYQLVVSPVLLGSGRAWLSGAATAPVLELLEARQFPSGNVLLRYTAQR